MQKIEGKRNTNKKDKKKTKNIFNGVFSRGKEEKHTFLSRLRLSRPHDLANKAAVGILVVNPLNGHGELR